MYSLFTDAEFNDFLENLHQQLLASKLTIATAESCTSGLLAYLLTEYSGSSAYFLGGVNSYSNELKIKLLKVSQATLQDFGAVSAETAKEMASGMQKIAHADLSVSITGIAGPTGGSPQKPIGTVWIGVSMKNNKDYQKHFKFAGQRCEIRWQAARAALSEISSVLAKNL